MIDFQGATISSATGFILLPPAPDPAVACLGRYGMGISPRPFLWRTITGRCWPGVLDTVVLKYSGRRGGYAKTLRKFKTYGNLVEQIYKFLCYHAAHVTRWLRKEDVFPG
jgi:hypothetical protein